MIWILSPWTTWPERKGTIVIIEKWAYARAGLLGNPSDGYYGKAISISVRNFGAQVVLYESPEVRIEPHPQENAQFKSIYELADVVQKIGYYGGERLIKATIKKFVDYCRERVIDLKEKNFTIRYRSDIPRQVGLAGSSAIITATLRALMEFYEVEIEKAWLPTKILKVETQELGITAGLQDRVIQVYEGCVYMDFNKDHFKKNGYGIYEALDESHLPNLYLAYQTNLSKVSGSVLSDMRLHYREGDSKTIDTMAQIASLAEEGKQALHTGNIAKLNTLMDRNFDLRCEIMDISEANRHMVETARRCGASAKFSGSGGTIIGIYEDESMYRRLEEELGKLGAQVIRPQVGGEEKKKSDH